MGWAAQALLLQITRPRLLRGCIRVLSPLSFPEFSWFQDLNATIRNMPPFAFGIHNEQYDYDMVII